MSVETTASAPVNVDAECLPLVPLEECVPETGPIRKYIDLARVYWPGANPINQLGVLVPTMLTELNLRGFNIPEMRIGLRAAPLAWYSLILGVTGSGKSTAFDTVRTFFDDNVYEKSPDEEKLFRVRLVNLEGTVSGFLGQMIKLKEADGTSIGLLHADEFSSILASRKGQFNANIAEFLQTIHDGREFKRHVRRSQEEQIDEALPKPKVTGVFLSTLEAVQPVFTQELASGGLFGRMVVFHTQEQVERPYMGKPLTPEEQEARKAVLDSAVEEMRSWIGGMSYVCQRDGSNPELRISNEAHSVYEERLHSFVKRQQQNVSVPIQSLIARIVNKAWILGALYATTRGNFVVSADDANRAINLLAHCYASSKYVAMRIGNSDSATAMDLVMDALNKAGPKGLKRSELYDIAGMPTLFRTKSGMETILATLADKELAEKRLVRTKSAGRPAEQWISSNFILDGEKNVNT